MLFTLLLSKLGSTAMLCRSAMTPAGKTAPLSAKEIKMIEKKEAKRNVKGDGYYKIGFFYGVATESIRKLMVNDLIWVEAHTLVDNQGKVIDMVKAHWQNVILIDNAKKELGQIPVKCHWYQMNKKMIRLRQAVKIKVERRVKKGKTLIIFNIYPEEFSTSPTCNLNLTSNNGKVKGIFVPGTNSKINFTPRETK